MITREALDPAVVVPAGPRVQHRRKVLVKKKKQALPVNKYAWVAGHALTLVSGLVFLSFYCVSWVVRSWRWTPYLAYKLSFTGVLVSYSVTVLTTFGSIIPPYNTLLATENFQMMVVAVMWLISRPSVLKLFPYLVISLLQLSSEFNIKPVMAVQDQLGSLAAASEIVIIIALLLDTLLFRGLSGYALSLYLCFYSLRINFTPYTQSTLLKFLNLIDDKLLKNNKSAIKPYFNKLKKFVEFRRSQTKKAYESNAGEEPPVKVEVDHTHENEVLPEEKNKPPPDQVLGRGSVKKNEVKLDDAPIFGTKEKNDQSYNHGLASHTGRTDADQDSKSSSSDARAGRTGADTQNGAGSRKDGLERGGQSEHADTSSSFATLGDGNSQSGANSAVPTEQNHQRAYEHNSSTGPSQQAANHGSTTSRSPMSKPNSQAGTPSKHSLDPRDQLIARAQQIRTEEHQLPHSPKQAQEARGGNGSN